MNGSLPTPRLASECALAQSARLTDLAALAVERGCRHYAHLAGTAVVPDSLRGLSHEVLACALLTAPMPGGFDAFRCGVMALSDLSNNGDDLQAAAKLLGVESRIGYVAKIGFARDGEKEFWRGLMERFPVATTEELPGSSRFVPDSGVGRSRSPISAVWLRTRHKP